jgi:hypothetical protein
MRAKKGTKGKIDNWRQAELEKAVFGTPFLALNPQFAKGLARIWLASLHDAQ